MTGVEMIAAERERQISEEGYTPGDDARYVDNELTHAAASYLLASRNPNAWSSGANTPSLWPWDPTFWKPGSAIGMLVKAGALIAAEIDRRVRAGDSDER